jgi:hypothetical protein
LFLDLYSDAFFIGNTESNWGTTVNDALRRIWKQTDGAYFKVLSQHLPGPRKITKRIRTVSLRVENQLRSSLIGSRSVNYSVAMFVKYILQMSHLGRANAVLRRFTNKFQLLQALKDDSNRLSGYLERILSRGPDRRFSKDDYAIRSSIF